MPRFKLAIAALLLLITPSAFAEQPLTSSLIQQWLNSIDSIQQWAEQQEGLDDNMSDLPSDEAFSVESMIAQLKGANLYGEAKSIMRDNGFDSPEQWADIQMRIVKAMVALEMEKENVNIDIQAQIDQINSNPSIPDDQKEMMINMMQSSMKMMESMSNASEADKSAIKPYLSQIKQKLESDEMGL